MRSSLPPSAGQVDASLLQRPRLAEQSRSLHAGNFGRRYAQGCGTGEEILDESSNRFPRPHRPEGAAPLQRVRRIALVGGKYVRSALHRDAIMSRGERKCPVIERVQNEDNLTEDFGEPSICAATSL